LVAAALILSMATVAAAAAPRGPRIAAIEYAYHPSRDSLITVSPDGGRRVRLVGGTRDTPINPIVLSPMSWRPDGAELAFSGLNSIYLTGADGGGARQVNVAGESPVFAPDGRTIAFTRGGGGAESIWTIDLVGGEQRLLSPMRRGVAYIPSSYSPDGRTLLATRFNENRSARGEPVALNLDTGGTTRLLPRGIEPVFSPDGTKIALTREIGHRRGRDLFVLDAATGRLRRLTRTPGEEEYFPSRDPSGARIAFARWRGRNFDTPNSIFQINADGSCERVVLGGRRAVYSAPAWQPGPGREAGPIPCRPHG
jgi:Tol biopolymer transport system component